MRYVVFLSPRWLVLLLAVLLSACINVIKPGRDFTQSLTPPSPDYAQEANWAALPTRADAADTVPAHSGLYDQQELAPVDVFFVHPTTYFGRTSWNASLADQRVNHFTDANTIRRQASVFNGTARVYAPRYRQATLFAFFDETSPSGQAALEQAYADIKTAFQYYLAHYNQGRPFIVAGHSQGTFHATRLLRELVDQAPKLRRQLVAAYLIGFNVKSSEYQVLKPCQDSTETGCYIAWNSVEWGNEYPPFQTSVAVNPLTWKTDTAAAPAALNLGGVPYAFNKVDKAVADAKVHDGLVWLHPPKAAGYPRFLLPGRPELRHSFHIADYALYYMNIRQNVAARARAYELRREQ